MMKLAFSSLGCPDWDITQIAQYAKGYGYDAVELRSAPDGHVSTEFNAAERKSVRGIFHINGIKICCLSCYSRFSDREVRKLKENQELLIRNVYLANDLKAPYIRAFIGANDSALSIEEITENTVKYLKPCCKIAREKEVEILIETHDSFSTGEQVKKILDAMDSQEGIGVLWDIEHSITAGEAPEQTVDVLKNKIRHVHVKDNDGKESCIPGRGLLDIVKVVKTLKEIDYEGCYSFEWEKYWKRHLAEPEYVFKNYMLYMKRIEEKFTYQ